MARGGFEDLYLETYKIKVMLEGITEDHLEAAAKFFPKEYLVALSDFHLQLNEWRFRIDTFIKETHEEFNEVALKMNGLDSSHVRYDMFEHKKYYETRVANVERKLVLLRGELEELKKGESHGNKR